MIMDKSPRAYPLNRPPKNTCRQPLPNLGFGMENTQVIETLFLVGPSSTGKSTLFHAIAKKLGLTRDQCITEVARTVMRNTDFSRKTVG